MTRRMASFAPARFLTIASLALVVALSVGSPRADAGLMTDLTVVNAAGVSSAFAPGTVYATVLVEAIAGNQVRFTVDALNPAGWKSFQFGFNVNTVATGAITIGGLPTGWGLDGSGNMNGFGSFEYRVGRSGSPTGDQDPLVFTVTTTNSLAAPTLEAAFYEANSQIPGRYYATHMRGSAINGVTSAFFTNGGPTTTAVPEPSTLLCCVTAAAGLGLYRRLRRRNPN